MFGSGWTAVHIECLLSTDRADERLDRGGRDRLGRSISRLRVVVNHEAHPRPSGGAEPDRSWGEVLPRAAGGGPGCDGDCQQPRGDRAGQRADGKSVPLSARGVAWTGGGTSFAGTGPRGPSGASAAGFSSAAGGGGGGGGGVFWGGGRGGGGFGGGSA